jgi:hypothetical protein
MTIVMVSFRAVWLRRIGTEPAIVFFMKGKYEIMKIVIKTLISDASLKLHRVFMTKLNLFFLSNNSLHNNVYCYSYQPI